MSLLKHLSQKIFVILWLTSLVTACFADTPHIPLAQLTPISYSNSSNAHRIEASGIILSPWGDAENYLIISDETEGKHARLYTINKEGSILSSLKINSKKKIDDLESISQYGTSLITCSSASANKHGTLEPKRHRCLKLSRQDKHLKVEASFDLIDAFKHAAKHSTDKTTRAFLRKALKRNNQDIEAHAIHNNQLLVGFKSPQEKGLTIILSLGNIEALFKNEYPPAFIWNRINFQGNDLAQHKFRLSDMAFLSPKELILTTRGKSLSALWKFNTDSQRLEKLATFAHPRAEGIAINSQSHEAILVFDGGNKKGSHRYSIHLR